MQIQFDKYQALGNDFLVIESARNRVSQKSLPRLAARICHRREGVGADGILYLSPSRIRDARADVYNSDGSWAEKSGNGLRIVGLHLSRGRTRRKRFAVEMGGESHQVSVDGTPAHPLMTTEIGRPAFETASVPMKSRHPFHINSPIKVGGVDFAVTCLSVGNPHAVLFVDNFDFDWQTLGYDIEHHRLFPERANVEFVKILNRKTLQVCDWERGAGATGSSGTGASAAVCAAVVLGAADRKCRVKFPGGDIGVNWRKTDDVIEISGPVVHVASGAFDFR